LGLCTAYGIVRQAGGWIDVDSVPGKGTRFEVWLPQTDREAAPGVTTQPSAQRCPGAETVLIVEDQPEVRRLALSILRHDGYQLLEAENGEQALQLCENHPGKIDLLVTDIVMPGLNGRDLATRLVQKRQDMKVLYISGYSADLLAPQGFLEPDTEYLPKPFSPAQLSTKVRELLGSGKPNSTLPVIDDDPAVRG
jgi:CheY-like chemotaxis protein